MLALITAGIGQKKGYIMTDQSDNERWYDDEIAPLLLEIARKCDAKGVPFLAAVEYAPGDRGKTFVNPTESLAMTMLSHCCKMGTNIDGYLIGIQRYCHENNVDTSQSIYLNRFGKTEFP